MSFTPAVSLTTQIADHIGRQIISGELGAEQRIQELRIAKQLGVSRGSVREALLILESRGLVRILPRRGALVSRMGASDISDLVEVSAELLVLFFVRLSKHLAGRGSADVAAIEAALDRAQTGVEEGSVSAFTEAKFDFLKGGLALVQASYLTNLIDDLMPSWHRLAVIAHRHPKADLQDNLRFTRALWDAVKTAETARVEELVRAHCRHEGRMAQEVLASPSANEPMRQAAS